MEEDAGVFFFSLCSFGEVGELVVAGRKLW
jgi:hypothetical protein